MIPQQKLSDVNLTAPYLYGDLISNDPLVAYHWGGIDLNNSTQGLLVQVWKIRVVGDDILLSAPSFPESVLLNAPLTTEVSLAFDQNMRPFCAYVQAGVSKFYWYDSSTGLPTITTLIGTSPRCTLDDPRVLEVGANDIILGYIRAGSLYFRAERDRYLTEYFLMSGVVEDLLYIGMNRVNRLQFGIGTII